MDKVIESVETMKKTTNNYCNDLADFPDGKQTRIIELEKEADELKQKIITKLIESRFRSKAKENFTNLLFVIDEIPENSRAAVVKLSYLGDCNPNKKINKNLRQLTDNADRVVRILKEAISNLLMKTFETSIKKSEDIENIEEKVDHLRRNNLNPKILSWAEKESNPAIVGLFLNMIDNIEEIVDQSEKAANNIRKIAIGQI